MSSVNGPELSTAHDIIEGSKFANPKLQPISFAARVEPSQSLLKGIILEVLAWLVIPCGITAFVVLFIATQVGSIRFNPCLAVATLFFLCYKATTSSFFRWRRLAKRYRINAQGDLRKDSRDPVLYLRPFYYDDIEDAERINRKTDEELLSLVLEDIGPVIAIGKPGERLPLIGATRIYCKDDDWQRNVERLMNISQLLVIHVGTSEGVTWEIETAAKTVGPNKLLISLLYWQELEKNTLQERYRPFKKTAEVSMNHALPGKNVILPEKINDAIFLTFNPDWTPRLIKIPEWVKVIFYFSFPTQLRETLRPVLKENGLKLGWFRTSIAFLVMLFLTWGVISPVVLIPLSSYITTYDIARIVGISATILNYIVFFPTYTVYGLLLGMVINRFFERILERRRKLSVPSITK